MARECKKGVFTLSEISAEAMKKYPGRWVNPESAYASVKTISRQLGAGDVNGKKKYKQIAAVDVARIFETLEKTNRGKKKAAKHTPQQADFFSLLPEPVTITKKTPEEIKRAFEYKPAPVGKEDAADIQLAELFQTADELARAFCNFAQALKAYTKGD